MNRILLAPAAAVLALAAAAPANAEIAMGLQTGGQSLALFDTAAPSAVTTVPLQGGPAQGLDTIAYDSATDTLYGTSAERKLYKIALPASAGSPATVAAVGTASFSSNSPLETGAAAAFNPANSTIAYAVDGLVRATDMDPFFTLPTTGAATTTSLSLHYADATVDPRVGGLGYSGATLFGLDTGSGMAQLVTVAADGLLTKVGSGLGPTTPDAADLEVGPSSGTTYAVFGAASMLYTLNTTAGTVGTGAPIGGAAITELALQANGSVSVGDATVSESSPGVIVTFSRSKGTTGTVKVDYATIDSTAKDGKDYAGGKGTLTFAPGDATRTVFFPVANDGAASGDKAFNVQLSNPTGGVVIGTKSSTVNITDAGAASSATPLPDNAQPVQGTTPPLKAGAKPTVAFSSTKLRKLSLKAFRAKNSVKSTFTCTSYCRADATLKLGTKTLGTASKTLFVATGGKSSVTLKLTKAGLKALGTTKARKLVLSVKVTDTANQITTASGSYTLTVPKAKPKKKKS